MAILLGYQWIQEHYFPAPVAPIVATVATPATPVVASPPAVATIPETATVGVPGVTPSPVAPSGVLDRAKALAATKRVIIKTPTLNGSLSLTGGRIDDLTLSKYRETQDAQSPPITLLSPSGSAQAYYAEFGFVDGKGVLVGPQTQWQADGATLTPTTPVVLIAPSSVQGLVFKRVITVDNDYMFTITDTVENVGTAAASVVPYALVTRGYTPETSGYAVLHEGPLGVFDGRLDDGIEYAKMKSNPKEVINKTSTGGWIGITDKYWLTALPMSTESESKARFSYSGDAAHDHYQVDTLGATKVVEPGKSVAVTQTFFAGAKEVSTLIRYASALNIYHFDKAIDFGYLYPLTYWFFLALQFIHTYVGNFGISILLFTVLIKGVLFPLANKSYASMNRMKTLQPDIKALQAKFADNKAKMNEELMALYKREKVNPMGGCLPLLVQIPVFFALYKVLFITIEMRQSPFYGWIHDLSAPDPTTVFNLFGLIPFDPTHLPLIGEYMHVGVWPLIMGVTMWAQQKMSQAPADPIQAKMMMALPVVFTFMLANFPAGLVIYWAWNNSLSIAQQWLLTKTAPPHKLPGTHHVKAPPQEVLPPKKGGK